MTIVSQDKKHALNSEYLKEIRIYNNVIKADVYENYEVNLGQYETEERTKEVFQEVIELHSNWENLKAGQPSGRCVSKCEMPQE